MAGVPAVMQAMLDDVAPKLRTGVRMTVETIDSGGLPEGAYAAPLGEVAARFPAVSIGSYPSFDRGVFRNQIVLRCKDAETLAKATEATRAALQALRG
jgi:molybdopterin-biosynthesis enzyme MoeA-like protein